MINEQAIINRQSQKIQEQKQRINELETMLETVGAFIVGGLESVNRLRQRDQARINDLEYNVSRLQYQLEQAFQLGTRSPQDELNEISAFRPLVESGKTGVAWAKVWYWHKDAGEQNVTFWETPPLLYPGSVDDAKKNLPNGLVPLVARLPMMEHVTIRTYDGILTHEELLAIAQDLAPYKYTRTEQDPLQDAFQKKRLEAFEKVWLRIDASPKYPPTQKRRKKTAKTEFFRAVETIFKNSEKREGV